MTETSAVQVMQAVKELINDQLQVVTYKWLAREFKLSAAIAQQRLSTFADVHAGKVSITYMLSGYQRLRPLDGDQSGSGNGGGGDNCTTQCGGRKVTPRRHVVQLVSADSLKDCRAQLEDDSLHVQIYSLQPTQPKDSAELWNRDQIQLEAAFAQLLKAPQDALTIPTFGCGGLSSIECAAATRGNARPPRKLQPPPTPVSIEPLRRTGASAAGSGVLTSKDGGMSALWKKAPPKAKSKAKSKVSAKSKTKSKTKSKAMEVEPAVEEAEFSGGSGSSEEEDTIAVANRGRRQMILTSDSDDDVAATPPGQAPADTGCSDVAAPGQKQSSAKAPEGRSAASEKKEAIIATGGSKRRKVTRTVVDAKGEETIETVWEDNPPSPSPALEGGRDARAGTATIGAPPTVSDVAVALPQKSLSHAAGGAAAASGEAASGEADSRAVSSGGSAMGAPPPVTSKKKPSKKGSIASKPKSSTGSSKGSGGPAARKSAVGKIKAKNQPGIASFFTKK